MAAHEEPGKLRALDKGGASDVADRAEASNAVERSLEDFILRANTALPAPGPQTAPAVRGMSAHRKRKGAGPASTLVVLGPQTPLAEETEIVARLPAEELAPARRSWSSLRLGAAFVAGAAIVLVVTRLISGGPRPVRPTVPPPVVTPAPTVSVAPAPIVVPLPVPAPEPVAAPPPAPEQAAEARRAVRKAPKPAARPAKAEATRKPSGLVDPFAN